MEKLEVFREAEARTARMRVFVGVELSQEMRKACVTMMQELASQMQGRWTLEENLYLTLAFIGEIEPSRMDEIDAIAREAAARFAPPEMTLAGVGVFEKKRDAIVHARVQCRPSAASMHDFLIAALQEAGLPADPGPFSPHITLARKAKLADGWDALAGLSAPCATFIPDHLTLFESARDEQNVLRYTPIRRWVWRNNANIVEI